MNDFNAAVHHAIDKAIVRDHEAARQLPTTSVTDEEIRKAAHDAFRAMVDEAEAGPGWFGFDHQRDAYEEGWADGYRAAIAATAGPDADATSKDES